MRCRNDDLLGRNPLHALFILNLAAMLAMLGNSCPFGARCFGGRRPPYKDTALPFDKRVADLVSRMTFQEKADQLQVNIPANGRLGIPACRWGTEAMHGLTNGGTMFPDSMALASTWDPALLQKVASAIGDEARARANPSGTQDLVLWCPNLNLARDPRWGRNMETYGEDPYLAGRMAVGYVKGLQGDDPKYLKTIASPKHFAVYSQEAGRASSNAYVSQRALHEYYLKPFEAAFVEGGAGGVMSAYNAINSVPCSANEWLLTTVLRDEWHFQGAVCTDNGAVGQIFSAHRYTNSDEEAVAAAINAGVDLITGSAGPNGAGGPGRGPADRVSQLVQSAQTLGLFKEGAVDRAVSRSLLMRFKLGLFDPPAAVPYSSLNSSVIGSAEHVQLALQSGREAITLLQNKPAPKGYGFERLLPLDLRRIGSIAIVGPNASLNLYGSYSGPGGGNGPAGGIISGGNRGPTPNEVLKSLFGDRIILHTVFASDTDASVEAARDSDVVLFFGGIDPRTDRAGSDRATMDLPYDQSNLLDKILRVNPLTVLILNAGSCVGLEPYKEKVPAIMMMWYDGEQGGNAIADVLLGRANPAGRLPVTFYKSFSDVPPIDDYELIHGRTYLYFSGPVTFPFGHGLSYTTFAYDTLKLSVAGSSGGTPANLTTNTKPAGEAVPAPVAATLSITNTGDRDGDEVVQLYVHKTESAVQRPLRQLVAFQRIRLAKGENREVTLTVPQHEFAIWDTKLQKFIVEPGIYEFMAGASSEDIRQRGTIEIK